jgi:hypothetical protein
LAAAPAAMFAVLWLNLKLAIVFCILFCFFSFAAAAAFDYNFRQLFQNTIYTNYEVNCCYFTF